uniref:Uncharacterized protein n=1 Tax=Ditylenchus dipsaci TaxID=166011 RepID=A0A915EFZ0_9BILA
MSQKVEKTVEEQSEIMIAQHISQMKKHGGGLTLDLPKNKWTIWLKRMYNPLIIIRKLVDMVLLFTPFPSCTKKTSENVRLLVVEELEKLGIDLTFLDPVEHSLIPDMCKQVPWLNYEKMKAIVKREAQLLLAEELSFVPMPVKRNSRFKSVPAAELDIELRNYTSMRIVEGMDVLEFGFFPQISPLAHMVLGGQTSEAPTERAFKDHYAAWLAIFYEKNGSKESCGCDPPEKSLYEESRD